MKIFAKVLLALGLGFFGTQVLAEEALSNQGVEANTENVAPAHMGADTATNDDTGSTNTDAKDKSTDHPAQVEANAPNA